MPRTVDHAERRAHISAALTRVAARTGLHAVTLRAVAAEAGVSLRLVQYYFETKAGLVHATLGDLERQSRRRWSGRLAGLPSPVTARAFTEAFCAEALPIDEPSRAFHLLWTSYAVLAMTDPELAARPFVAGPDRLEADLAAALTAARTAGELRPDADPATEAARLLALSHGLGTSVLVGQRPPEAARAVLRHHLAELFRPAPTPDGTTA
ncbi:TetR/AcrR family transcriptional regulator [Streptomyces sp. NPDC057702]|uniref:TetR/AcrR family transcriptional regulator n=1 Tax=unclassified Streptomyces TaxID=2593676 RepID=UPI00367CC6D3